jgi:hypothetical protein
MFGRVKCLKTMDAVSKALDYKTADPVLPAKAAKPGKKAGKKPYA